MATYATLTVPVQDIIGADFNASRASVWIEPNVPFVLADSIRVGGRREQVVNGVATFANLVTTDTADNPASFGYRVTITAPPKGAAARKDIVNLTTADFPFTATAVLTDISEAWDNVVLPVEWRSAFRDEMEALRDQVQDISGISTPDGVVAALVADSGSDTATALAAEIAAEVDPIAPDGGVRAARKDSAPVNVKAYGAVGDGTTDDTAAIQAAIDAAVAQGTPAYVPEGTYRISQSGANLWALQLNTTGSRIQGPGTLKLASGTAVGVRGILITAPDCVVEGLSIDMNRAGQTVDPTRHAVFLSNVARTAVRNMKITGATGDGVLVSSGSSDVTVTGCRITNCGRNGVTLFESAGGSVNNVLVQGCHIEADIQPVDSEPTSGTINKVRIVGNYLKSTTNDYAITMSGTASQMNRDWTVTGNTMIGPVWTVATADSVITGNTIDARATTKHGIHAEYNTDSMVLSGNRIYAPSDKSGVFLGRITTSRPTNWTISNNAIHVAGGTTGRGINLEGCGPVVVTGNIIRGVNASQGVRVSSTTVMEAVTLAANDIDGFAYGIFLSTTSNIERLIVANNTIDNSQGTPTVTAGIYVTGTAALFLDTVMSGNIIDPIYTTAYTLGNVRIRESGGSTPTWSGNGTPEGVVTSPVGSIFKRRDGGAGTSFYIKESGTGNTGWAAK